MVRSWLLGDWLGNWLTRSALLNASFLLPGCGVSADTTSSMISLSSLSISSDSDSVSGSERLLLLLSASRCSAIGSLCIGADRMVLLKDSSDRSSDFVWIMTSLMDFLMVFVTLVLSLIWSRLDFLTVSMLRLSAD